MRVDELPDRDREVGLIGHGKAIEYDDGQLPRVKFGHDARGLRAHRDGSGDMRGVQRGQQLAAIEEVERAQSPPSCLEGEGMLRHHWICPATHPPAPSERTTKRY